MTDETRIGILISGRGSNMVAIAKSIQAGRISQAKIGIVISNKPDVPGLTTALDLGISTCVIPSKGRARPEQEHELLDVLRVYHIKLVCLAGYMRILSPQFVANFSGHILNIHPSLLPAFPGEDAHTDVLAYGEKVSGCTVHLVNEKVDEGPIVVQRTVPVLEYDTKDDLAARVLIEEHLAYTEAINKVLSGDYAVVGRRFVRKG